MRRALLVAILAAAIGACATTPREASPLVAFEDPALDAVTADELVRFDGARDLRRYFREVRRIDRRRNYVPPPEGESPMIIVTGSRVTSAAPSPSITNNQTRGVDEGDIVKQIGNYLLVLQDGRIFAIDIGSGQGARWRRPTGSTSIAISATGTPGMTKCSSLAIGFSLPPTPMANGRAKYRCSASIATAAESAAKACS